MPTLFFQCTLPSAIKVGQWVRIQFIEFDPVILLVEKIEKQSISGFDLYSGKAVTLRMNGDRQVYNKENWLPRLFETLVWDEVVQHAKRRQRQLDDLAINSKKIVESAETAAKAYRETVPATLKRLAPQLLNA